MTALKKTAALLAMILAVTAAAGSCTKNEPPAGTEEVMTTVPATTSAGETTTLGKYIITCAELAYRIINDDSFTFPAAMEVTDETMLSEVMRYDMSLADEYSVYMQMISTDLFELAVIRASDGNVSAVKDILEARRTYLRDQAAYYPEQVRAADAAVVGELNGVCYLICHENAAEIEKKLMFLILRN